MAKVIKSITIDEEIVERLEVDGTPFSRLVNLWAQTYMAQTYEDFDIEMVVKTLDADIDASRMAISEAQDIITRHSQRIDRLSTRRDSLLADYNEMKMSGIITALIKELNTVIINAGYDDALVMHRRPELVEDIKSYNPYFDLAHHVDRLYRIIENK